MSQKQKFLHNKKKPTAPEGGWVPAYKTVENHYFKYLVDALDVGRILPTEQAAEVYNKHQYLWPINPYKFTPFFKAAIAFMSSASDDESSLLSSLPSLASNNPSTQSLLPNTIFGNNREEPPESKSEHEFSQSQPTKTTGHHTMGADSMIDDPRQCATFDSAGRLLHAVPLLPNPTKTTHRQVHFDYLPVDNGNGTVAIYLDAPTSWLGKNMAVVRSHSCDRTVMLTSKVSERASYGAAQSMLTSGSHNFVRGSKVIENVTLNPQDVTVVSLVAKIKEVYGAESHGFSAATNFMVIKLDKPIKKTVPRQIKMSGNVTVTGCATEIAKKKNSKKNHWNVLVVVEYEDSDFGNFNIEETDGDTEDEDM